MKKKFLAMILAIFMLAELFPMAAFADTESGNDDLHDCPGSAFTDMPAEANWAHKGIDFCVESGLMKGITDLTFCPEGTLTRGQLVTILYRVVEEPAVKFRDIFSDVAEGRYFSRAVIWAANNQIVTGYPDGSFCPQNVITREQIAVILYRCAGEPAVTGSLDFPDGRTVSKYAMDAMLWATQNGLIKGIKSNGVTNLSPRTSANRAQIASIMMRFLEIFEKENLKGYGADAGEDKIALAFTPNRWPIVDGATAFLPFYQEMAARMLGVSTEEAADYIMCSTTDYAYPYLWEKKVDLVFCLRPSEEQVKRAAQNGVVFEEVPFANEGFVFFVNKDNPVDSITVQQLHDIYAGKITNWKELGGNDEEIIAYQRTEGSGSQTGLYLHVIDPSEIQEPPTEMRIKSMDGIIDVVAGYKNAAGAIGYSYRYFVTNMHYDEQIKMLKVNGIYPDYESIANGRYPLISDICAVYREDEPADSAVRKIARWCASSQGAVLAKELGYVPTAEAIGTLYKENHPSDDAVIDFAEGNPCPECTVISAYYSNNLSRQTVGNEDYSYVQISGLKNKEIQNVINKKIYDTAMELFEVPYPPYPGIRTQLAAFETDDKIKTYLSTAVEGCFNHMLSIKMTKYSRGLDSIYFEDIRTLNLDLTTGKEIYIGDLFADNMDGIAYINEKIFEESAKPEAFDEPPDDYLMSGIDTGIDIYFRRAFEGINFNQKYYIDQRTGSLHIILDYENPEIANIFTPTDYAIDMLGINAYESRFMTPESIFTNEKTIPALFERSYRFCDDTAEWEYKGYWSEGRNIHFDSIIRFYDEKDRNYIKTAIISDESLAELKAELESLYDAREQEGWTELLGVVTIGVAVWGFGNYINIESHIRRFLSDQNPDDEWEHLEEYYDKAYFCIKADSGEPVTLQEIFKPDFDYDASISEMLITRLKSYFENAYSDEDYHMMSRELLDHMDGFAVQEDSLYLYCSDYANILSRYVLDNSDILMYGNEILRFNYKDLGAENLTIFG